MTLRLARPGIAKLVGAGVFGVIAAVSLLRAPPTVAGMGADTGPRSWANSDLRGATRSQILRAHLRLAALCNVPVLPGYISIEIVLAANSHAIDPSKATFLSCIVGAPPTATCANIAECAGVGDGPKGVPVCDGDLLRVTRASTSETSGVSCSAVGEQCFHNEVGSLCGVGLCSAGETYSCDGDALLACQEGVRSRTPCGRGMTCGRSAGSKILDCVGKGPACAEDRCDGDTLVECARDAFGKGLERRASCADFGLVCATEQAKKGLHAACVPKPGACDPDSTPPMCTNGKLQLCVAGTMESLSCAELGLSGACSLDGGTLACK